MTFRRPGAPVVDDKPAGPAKSLGSRAPGRKAAAKGKTAKTGNAGKKPSDENVFSARAESDDNAEATEA